MQFVTIKAGRHRGRVGLLRSVEGDRRKVEVGKHGLILDLSYKSVAPATEDAVKRRSVQ